MGDVEGIIFIDVVVDVRLEIVEEVQLEGVGGLHYEGVQVHPPEPDGIFLASGSLRKGLSTYHSALGYFRMLFRIVSTFSQLSRHS